MRSRALVLSTILAAGCGSAPRIEVESPPLLQRLADDGRTIAYCFGSLPHIPGSKPFVFGGVCCHEPTQEIVEAYRRDGTVGPDVSVVSLRALYAAKGVKLESDHVACNNRCEFGPHVVKGGHCMVAPTPGTVNYEEIRSGRFPKRAPAPPPSDAENESPEAETSPDSH